MRIQVEEPEDWIASVPPSVVDMLPKSEIQRQSLMFELIQGEINYMGDLDLIQKVRLYFELVAFRAMILTQGESNRDSLNLYEPLNLLLSLPLDSIVSSPISSSTLPTFANALILSSTPFSPDNVNNILVLPVSAISFFVLPSNGNQPTLNSPLISPSPPRDSKKRKNGIRNLLNSFIRLVDCPKRNDKSLNIFKPGRRFER